MSTLSMPTGKKAMRRNRHTYKYGVYARRLGMATCGAVRCGAAASDRRMEERELIDLADPRTDPCRLLLLWVRRRDLDCQAG